MNSSVRLILLLLSVVMGCIIASCSIGVIDQGEVGVRVTLGKASSDLVDAGVYVRNPFITKIIDYPLKIKKSDIETSAASKDLQEIKTTVSINWAVQRDKARYLYVSVGNVQDLYDNIITPAANEVMKAEVAKYTAEELITKRMELKKNVDDSLGRRLSSYGVVLSSVNFTNFGFSADFGAAIEKKQVAEQQAQQAVFDAQKATQQAQSVINMAKGQAEAQRLLQSTTTPQIIELRAIDKWDGKLPQVMSSATPFIKLGVNQ